MSYIVIAAVALTRVSSAAVLRAIRFSSDAHKHFFFEQLNKSGCADCYHQALFYVLGLNADTRQHINRLFDYKERTIRVEGLNEGWQTSGSQRLCRLAFNLWNGYAEPGEECSSTPYNLFDCGYAPYMLDGIRLRYPEYCRDLDEKGQAR